MSKKFGDILYNRTSWGRKELKETFGIEIPDDTKAVLNVNEAGSLLLNQMLSKSSWNTVSAVVDELLKYSATMSPTINQNVLHGDLMRIWNAHLANLMDEVPNEFRYVTDILSNIKNDFNTGTVGRKKLIASITKHSLNLFVTFEPSDKKQSD